MIMIIYLVVVSPKNLYKMHLVSQQNKVGFRYNQALNRYYYLTERFALLVKSNRALIYLTR